MFGWVSDADSGPALSHCCVGWTRTLLPGMFGWVVDVALGLALLLSPRLHSQLTGSPCKTTAMATHPRKTLTMSSAAA